MRVVKVRLRNFRSHEETEVPFDVGVNAIIGRNGAGKTSLLEGIAYALFPELFRGFMEDLRRRGAGFLEVELEFEQAGRVYKVWRRRDRSGPQARLMVKSDDGWRLLQTSQRDVSRELARILGTGPETFVTAMYVRQGEILGFLSERPAERKETINRLLGGELFDKIERDLGETLRAFRVRLERTAGEISSLKREIEVKQELTKRSAEVRSRLSELDASTERLKVELSAKETELESLRVKRDEYIKLKELERELRDDLARSVRRLGEIESEIERLESELSEVGRLEQLAELEPELMELHSLNESISSLSKELDGLKRAQEELARAKNVVESLEAARQKYLEITAKLNAVNAELAKIEEKKTSLAQLRKSTAELEGSLAMVESSLKLLLSKSPPELELKSVDDLCERSSKIMAEARDLEAKLSAVSGEVRELIGELKVPAQMKAALQSVPGICPLCESELSAERSKFVKDRLDALISDRESKLAGLNLELNRLKGLASALREFETLALELDLPTLVAKRRELTRELEGLRKRIAELESELEVANRLLSEKEQLELEAKDLAAQMEELAWAERQVAALKPQEEERLRRISEITSEIGRLRQRRDDLLRKLGPMVEDLEKSIGLAKEARERLKSLQDSIRQYQEVRSSREREVERMEELKGRLADVEERLNALGFDEDSYSKLESLVRRLRQELQETLTEQSELRGKLEAIESRLKEIRDREAKLEDLIKEKKRLESFVSALEEVRKAVGRDGIQRALRDATRPVLEHYVNEVMSQFGIDFDRVELDEDYDVRLLRGGERFSFRQLSGGEQVALALALRLGLAKAMAGTSLETILLDEPTVHLDAERRRELVAAIKELDLPQVIVVTHAGEFEEIADSLFSIERVEGRSKLARMEEFMTPETINGGVTLDT